MKARENGPKEEIKMSKVQIVEYKKPSKKSKLEKSSDAGTSERTQQRPNIREFKLDIFKLLAQNTNAASAAHLLPSNGHGASAAKHAHAIALGAEAPKRKAVNYKQLQADLKKWKEEEKQNELLRHVSLSKPGSKSKKGASGNNRRRGDVKKSSSGMPGGGGGVNGFGSWRGGVLKLSKEDIHRIKSHKPLKL